MVLHLFYALKKIFHLLKKRRGANIAPFFFISPFNFLHPLKFWAVNFLARHLLSFPLSFSVASIFLAGMKNGRAIANRQNLKSH
jgi:hypothetical protein